MWWSSGCGNRRLGIRCIQFRILRLKFGNRWLSWNLTRLEQIGKWRSKNEILLFKFAFYLSISLKKSTPGEKHSCDCPRLVSYLSWKINCPIDLTSQQKPESRVSRGNIPLGTRLPSYGPIHVPAGMYSFVQTPSLCPGMLDRHSWTSFGKDIMEYVISISSNSSLSSILSIPIVNKILIIL